MRPQKGVLFTISTRDATNNTAGATVIQTAYTLPRWPSWPNEAAPFCGATSAGGTSAMLMLKPEDAYAAEFVTFGGYRYWCVRQRSG